MFRNLIFINNNSRSLYLYFKFGTKNIMNILEREKGLPIKPDVQG